MISVSIVLWSWSAELAGRHKEGRYSWLSQDWNWLVQVKLIGLTLFTQPSSKAGLSLLSSQQKPVGQVTISFLILSPSICIYHRGVASHNAAYILQGEGLNSRQNPVIKLGLGWPTTPAPSENTCTLISHVVAAAARECARSSYYCAMPMESVHVCAILCMPTKRYASLSSIGVTSK